MNQFIISLVFSTILIFSQAVFGQATSLSTDCLDPNDPYIPQVAMFTEQSLFFGQCVDTDVFRPAKVIENTENTMEFANYLHNDKFWRIKISKDQFKKVLFQIVRFNVLDGKVVAAHAQMRFLFHSPIALYDQITGEISTETVNDLIVSFEAARPKDIAYNFAQGVASNYALAGLVGSGQQKAKVNRNVPIEQYGLNLGSSEVARLAFSAIKKSDEIKLDLFYNTIWPNCTTVAFDLIDELPSVKMKNPRPFLTVISNDPIAKPSLEALVERKLLEDKQYPTLNSELEGIVLESFLPKDPSFLLDTDSYKNALIFYREHLTPEQEKVVDEIESLIVHEIVSFMQVMSAYALISQDTGTNTVIFALKELGKGLQKLIVKINGKLGQEPFRFLVFFAPLPIDRFLGEFELLQEKGIRARLPFRTFRMEDKLFKAQNTLWQMSTGMSDVAKKAAAQNMNMFLRALALRFSFQKDHSKVISQFVLGLDHLEVEVHEKMPGGEIDKLIVPKANNPIDVTSAIFETQISYQDNQQLPRVHIDFGALKSFRYDDINNKNPKYGLLEINKKRQRTTAPYLRGKLAKVIEFPRIVLESADTQFEFFLDEGNTIDLLTEIDSFTSFLRLGRYHLGMNLEQVDEKLLDGINNMADGKKEDMINSLMNQFISQKVE